MDLTIKWSGNEYKITGLGDTDTVLDLKNAIHKDTGVLPERQKLLGLKYKGKPPDDDVQLIMLKLKPNMKIMMMGTREEELQKVAEPPEDIPEVLNDFDFEEDEIAIEHREEYLNKIERRVKEYEIKILHEPRPDKKLLVLDIDYTLFDHRSAAETGTELMRPFLHEFLESAYKDYDIVIWSATSMKWIEAKMRELDCVNQPNYKISFYLDSLAMITVDTGVDKYGVIEVKPLGVIWGKYPQWGKHNTIMFDDLRRNFLMNPKNGLKIRPFRQAHFNRDKDRELVGLSRYLRDIVPVEDFTTLNHRKWEKYKPEKKRKRESEDDTSPAGDSASV